MKDDFSMLQLHDKYIGVLDKSQGQDFEDVQHNMQKNS